MKKMPLKKLFHIDREDYKSEYENALMTMILFILI